MVLKGNICLFLRINSVGVIDPTYVVKVKIVYYSQREWIYEG